MLLGTAAVVLILAGGGMGAWWWTHRIPDIPQIGEMQNASGVAPEQQGATTSKERMRAAAGQPQDPSHGQIALPVGKEAENALQAPAQTGSNPPSVPEPKLTPAEKRQQEHDQSADSNRYTQDKLETMDVPQRLNVGNLTLSDGIQLADKNPDKAVAIFRNAIAANPTNANAYAWLATVLYEQGKYGEFNQAIRMAEGRGVSREQMASVNGRFRAKLMNARLNNRLN